MRAVKAKAAVLLAASLIGFLSSAGDVCVWPEGLGRLAAASGTVIERDQGSVKAVFKSTAPWPGVLVTPKEVNFDFSRFSEIVVSVSNTLSRPQRIWMKLRRKGVAPLMNAGSVFLGPYETGLLRHEIDCSPWRLDAPLNLGNLKGAPKGPDAGLEFAAVTEMHIFRKNAEEPISGSFAVQKVAAFGPQSNRPVLSASGFLPFVDRFGQFRHSDWPGKMHCEKELSGEWKREERWLAEHPGWPTSEYDRFGGWAKGPRLEATGRFRTENVGGKWHLVNPDGRLFFSFGIAGVRQGEPTRVKGRERWFDGLPPNVESFDFAGTNLIRKYGTRFNYGRLAHRRMKAWGINTVGNWSGRGLRGMRLTPYVADLATKGPPISGAIGWGGRQFPDPFSDEFALNICKAAKDEAKRSGGDEWCLGWFVDNELPWSNDDRYLARGVLASPPEQPAKQASWMLLMRKYGSVAALNAAWNTCYKDEKGFLDSVMVPDESRTGADLDQIQAMVARKYFRVVRDAVKAADPNVLYLGCRFSNGGASVWRAAAEFCDVVSANIYRDRPLYVWPENAADRPLIVGEFHFGACDRGLFSPGLVRANSQQDRAFRFENYIRAAVADSRIVGAHWFKWRDQSLTGRDGDGENYQLGFVDVCDTPYPEMVISARRLAGEIYR